MVNSTNVPAIPGQTSLDATSTVPSAQQTRELKWIREQTYNDLAEQEAYRIKGEVGHDQLRRLHHSAVQNFVAAASDIVGHRNRNYDKELQRVVNDFTADQIEDAKRHVRGVTEAGAGNIGRIVHRSVTPPPKEPSWWEKTFG
jgi:hypothetical protein